MARRRHATSRTSLHRTHAPARLVMPCTKDNLDTNDRSLADWTVKNVNMGAGICAKLRSEHNSHDQTHQDTLSMSLTLGAKGTKWGPCMGGILTTDL